MNRSDSQQHELTARTVDQRNRRLGAALHLAVDGDNHRPATGNPNDNSLAAGSADNEQDRENQVNPERAHLDSLLAKGYERADLHRGAPPTVMRLVPEELARRYHAIPLRMDADRLVVAAADPSPELQNLLMFQTRREVVFAVATRTEIERAINLGYPRIVDLRAHADADTGAAGDAPDARETVETLLIGADRARASDLHLEPDEKRAWVRYRIDGVLHDMTELPLPAYRAVLGRLKVMGNLNVVEHRQPQDGQFQFPVGNDRRLDVRLSTLPSVHGEKAVLRILDRGRSNVPLAEVGFEPAALDAYRAVIRNPQGMVLVVGPTGSGKTTTLYATISELDRLTQNIITLEDPVEMVFSRVTQVQVNPKSGLTFATGLRSILRQDPDVIVVGEIRDQETAAIATQAALTGHLVLSSLHATDTVAAVFRLLDLGVAPYFVAAALRAVLAQRLVRLVCSHCATETDLTPEETDYLDWLKLQPPSDVQLRRGTGCANCSNTGYLDRTAVVELLVLDADLRHLIGQGAGPAAVTAHAREVAGLVPLTAAALAKVWRGETTVTEIMRAVYA